VAGDTYAKKLDSMRSRRTRDSSYIDALQARASAGDVHAQQRLILELSRANGVQRLGRLRREVHAATPGAAEALLDVYRREYPSMKVSELDVLGLPVF
jgi:uncharacterized protein YhbP (UPF0306 family)